MAKITLKGKVKLTVKQGNKVIKEYEQELRSFVRNFDHLLALLFAAKLYGSSPAVTLKDVYGTDVDVYGVASLTYGRPTVWFGSGTTPVSPDDYTLASDLGGLFHPTVDNFTYDDANRTITVSASALNGSGGDVTVAEVGLILNTNVIVGADGTKANHFLSLIHI